MLDPNEMTDLQPSTRLEVGRCWNAYARFRQSELDARLSRNEFMSRLVALRAGHGLSTRQLARMLGIPDDQIRKWSASYRDPNYETAKRKRATRTTRERGQREEGQLAGRRSAPGTEPTLARIERNAREVRGE